MRNKPTPRQVRSAHESRSASVRAAAAAPSRRQLSHWQREQRQQRALFVGIGALIAAIVAVFGGTLVYDNFVRANDVVAEVGSNTITTSTLVEAMRSEARRIDAQARQQPGANAARVADQEKRQLPDRVLNDLLDRYLIEQEARRLGVNVTPSELDDRQRLFVAEFDAAINPAPTAVPTSTPEGGAAPTAAGTPTPLPTSTPVPTLESAAYPAALQQFLERNNYTEPDFREALERFVLREKVEKAFGEEQVQANQEQVHARHILVTSEDQAIEVRQQIEGGADFAEIAQQRSADPGSKANGGDLGWFARGVMEDTFQAVAFALEPGQLSSPVQTRNGFHVIQVLERSASREVPESQLQNLRQKAFSDWLDRRRASQDVKLQLSTAERDWALARLGVRP